MRGLGPDGHLWVVVSSAEWERQLQSLAPEILSRVNERMGRPTVKALDIRVRRDRRG